MSSTKQSKLNFKPQNNRTREDKYCLTRTPHHTLILGLPFGVKPILARRRVLEETPTANTR